MREADKTGGGHKGRFQRGAALVIVLMLLTVMAAVLAEFSFEMRVQTRLMKNHEAKVKARYVSRAGQNAAGGLLRHTDPASEMFNNEIVQFFKYDCLSMDNMELMQGMSEDDTGLFGDNEEEEDQEESEPEIMEACGSWSLSIPYVLEDTPIDIDIYDEQARLNLNALVKVMPRSGEDGEAAEMSFTRNDVMFHVIFELFRYQVFRHELEISDMDLVVMLERLVDYMDYGMVDGGFDDDRESYFEYEDDDKIVALKNGPLDTVDEIRYLPGMTDELFEAVKPYLTVYPVSTGTGIPDDGVNVNAASVEVLYALFRGTSYNNGEPELSEEEALEYAYQTINEAYAGNYMKDKESEGNAVNVPIYKRTIPPEVGNNTMLKGLLMNDRNTLRFYRVVSTAMTDDGLQTRITKVVMFDKTKNELQALYYREE